MGGQAAGDLFVFQGGQHIIDHRIVGFRLDGGREVPLTHCGLLQTDFSLGIGQGQRIHRLLLKCQNRRLFGILFGFWQLNKIDVRPQAQEDDQHENSSWHTHTQRRGETDRLPPAPPRGEPGNEQYLG